MGGGLIAERLGEHTRWSDLAAADPTNPFVTRAMVLGEAARREPWLLSIENHPAARAVGYIARGRLERTLAIPSIPGVGAGDPFWTGLACFCRRTRVDGVHLQSFGSPEGSIPSMGHRFRRRERSEFVLDLQDGAVRLSSNHRRNLKKARGSALTLVRRSDLAACDEHDALVGSSMTRRRARGEAIADQSSAGVYRRLVDAGAGVVVQVRAGDAVLSSMLLLLAERGAYYHSAGTSPQGMTIGASTFLVCELAERLREEGMETFNLGGAGADEVGLGRFKRGFRPREVALGTASFQLGGPLRRRFTWSVRAARGVASTLRRVARAG